MQFICSECGTKESVKTRKAHCECGGLWQLDFNVPDFKLEEVEQNNWSIFKYKSFLPLLDDSWKEISLGEGLTPIISFTEDLMLKMDYYMPTLSFKDRGAAMLISHCRSIGVNSVVQDSSGNAGNSVAAYCARADIECEIFVPEGTSTKKIDMIKAHGAQVNIVPGSRDHCADVCREKVEKEDVYYANHVYNPFFYQGTKTYIYEVYEQLNRIPKNIFVPLGNGTLFIGIVKGLQELIKSGLIKEMPQVIAIQSENCDPISKAVKNNKKVPAAINVDSTLAEGIAIGEPKRGKEILEYIYQYNIKVITAPENKILKARKMLAAEGVYCEHTTAASYAAYLKYAANNNVEDSLIPMCGAGLKSDH